MSFDPYYAWLGIPPSEQPPNHYRLLGLTPLEANPVAISNAADRQMSHVRTFQNGPHVAHSQRLLSEISNARICLLNSQAKAGYDAQLRSKLEPAPPPPPSVPGPSPATADTISLALNQESPAAIADPAPRRRVEKNPIVEVAKIAAGGLAGCAIAVLLLRYVFLLDITGLLPVPNSGADTTIAANEPEPVVPRPTSTTTKPPTHAPVTQVKPPVTPIEPAAESSTGESNTTPAEASDPTPPAAGKKKGKKGKTMPGPSPMPAATTVAVLREKRLPPPPQAEQDEVTANVEREFGLARLTAADEKFRVADELVKASRAADVTPAEQYALVLKAAELAEQAGDAQRMGQLIEVLTQRFEVTPLPLEVQMLERFAAAARSAEAIESLVLAARPVVQFALREERFDLAGSLTDATLKACNQPAGMPHRKFVADGQKLVARQQREWEAHQQALAKLSASPDDPAAHLVAGTWFVTARGDWQAALPHLSRCSKPALKSAADLELASPAKPEETLAAAEAWHDAGQATGANDVWLVRALYWYSRTDKGRLSKPAAAEIEKVVQELRADESAQRAAQALAGAPGRGQIDGRLPQAARRAIARYC